MRQLTYWISVVLAVFLLASCKSTESSNIVQCNYLPKRAMPNWVTSPEPENGQYFYGYGVANQPQNNFSQLRQNSRDDARAELSQSIVVKIKSSLVSATSSSQIKNHSEVTSKVNSLIESESNMFLSQSHVVDTWLDQGNCHLWTKVQLDKKSQQQTTERITAQATAYQHQLMKNISDQLDTLKKETSNDPRKELANRGLSLTEEDFGRTVYRADIENIELYLKAGMKFSDAFLPNSIVPLPHVLMTLELEKLKGIFAVFAKSPGTGPDLSKHYLQHAALLGDIDKLNLLLSYGADPNSKYTGNIDLGSLDSDALTMKKSSSLCVANFMINELKQDGGDASRWYEIKSKLVSRNAKATGEISFRRSFTKVSQFSCNGEKDNNIAALHEKRAKQCKQYFSHMSLSELEQHLIPLTSKVSFTTTPKTISEVAYHNMLVDIASNKYQTKRALLNNFKKELQNSCQVYKPRLCADRKNNDYRICQLK